MELIVRADQVWNDFPDVQLSANHAYQFEVISHDDWRDASIRCDANGYSRWWLAPFIPLRRVPAARWFALIGAINRQGEFTIGLGTTYTPKTSGHLSCFANDAMSRYGNNHGSLRLRVTPL